MHCLKCGVAVDDGRSFCESCLQAMESHPVKPGTAVVIPKRPQRKVQTPMSKQSRAEEMIEELERKVRRLQTMAVLMLALVMVCVGIIGYLYFHMETGFGIGQNYHSATQSTSDTTIPGTSTDLTLP